MIKFNNIIKESISDNDLDNIIKDISKGHLEDLENIINPKFVLNSIEDIVHQALKSNIRTPIHKLSQSKQFKSLFYAMRQQFIKDHSDVVDGDYAVLYRGLNGPILENGEYSQALEELGRLEVGDDVSLKATNRPIQGFTTDENVAEAFAKGAFKSVDITDENQDGIGIIAKASINIDAIIWYYDFLPSTRYMQNEKEIIVDISLFDNNDCTIYKGWTCVDQRYALECKKLDKDLLGWKSVEETPRRTLDGEIQAVLRDRLAEVYDECGYNND
jgi:hypothetical protein